MPSWQGQRGTRHERGYGAAWVRMRKVILQRDSHLCQPCLRTGRATPATSVDHIKPKSQGGADEQRNLEAICTDCHKAKTAREALEAQGRTMALGFTPDARAVWPD